MQFEIFLIWMQDEKWHFLEHWSNFINNLIIQFLVCGGTINALYMWSDKHTGILLTDMCADILRTDMCADILRTDMYRLLQLFYVSLIY